MDDRKQIDIAIVGAGVAGTYCGWRLQTAQNGRNAVLFEMSGRIGGRLLSVPMPGIPDVLGELGGMRFLSLQRMVSSLTKYLELETSDFPMGGPLNIATLRSMRLRNAVFEYPQMVPYRMLPGEQGLGPGDLLVKAIKTVIPNATSLTPQEWEQVKQTTMWNGDYLYNWGLWNVLLSTNSTAKGNPPLLSSEAYALLYDGGGYEFLVDNWNCAEAFEYLLIDFPRSAQYLRLTKGYQTLPSTLAQQFTAAGGKINMQHRLVTFAPKQVNGATVVDLDVLDETSNVLRYYQANALILAMPQRSLEILAQETPTLTSPDVKDLLKSVMSMPAYKALALYETALVEKAAGGHCGTVDDRSAVTPSLLHAYRGRRKSQLESQFADVGNLCRRSHRKLLERTLSGAEVQEEVSDYAQQVLHRGGHREVGPARAVRGTRRFCPHAARTDRRDASTPAGSDTVPVCCLRQGLGRGSLRRRLALLAAGGQGLADAAARASAGRGAPGAYLRGILRQPAGLG